MSKTARQIHIQEQQRVNATVAKLRDTMHTLPPTTLLETRTPAQLIALMLADPEAMQVTIVDDLLQRCGIAPETDCVRCRIAALPEELRPEEVFTYVTTKDDVVHWPKVALELHGRLQQAQGNAPTVFTPAELQDMINATTLDPGHSWHLPDAALFKPGFVVQVAVEQPKRGQIIAEQVIADGNHRAQRCIDENRTFRAWVVTPNIEPMVRIDQRFLRVSLQKFAILGYPFLLEAFENRGIL